MTTPASRAFHRFRRLPVPRALLALCPVLALGAFATGLAVWPVGAATTTTGLELPTDPLITESQVPPNVLFVLDDSGSMANAYMPDEVPKTGATAAGSGVFDDTCDSYINNTSVTYLACNAYTRNTLYYNPATTYAPWTLPDGSIMTGGTDYTAAYSDTQYVPYSGTGPSGYGKVVTTSSTTNLSGSVQTFYVPKDTTSTDKTNYLATATNYYRYQILTDGRIIRSEYASSNASPTTVTQQLYSVTANYSAGTNYTGAFTIPANVSSMKVTTSGGSVSNNARGVDLSVGTSSASYVTSANNGNSESVSVSSPAAGTWYFSLYAQTNFTASTGNPVIVTLTYTIGGDMGCETSTSGYGWRNCTETTPTGRAEAAEMRNFATWYSYHRTRNKAAKAGASQAFAALGGKVRVGFRTINGRATCGGSSSGNCTYSYASSQIYNLPTQAVPIPVNYNDGLFTDTGTDANASAYNNRTQWYNRLFSATASSSTPLRSALTNAGIYYQSAVATGPYGPESSADQYICRQNFTILTTDGYWNESYSNSTIGNADAANGAALTSSSGTSYTYTAADPYKDSWSQTLADVAMYYWKNDLRTDLANGVPVTTKDPAFWQHMTTFSIGLGLSGTVDQTSVDEVLSNGKATVNGVAGWPQPVNNTQTTIDDLLHAAVNGHGTYVGASNPTEFSDGLTDALAAVTERAGSFSNATATSTSASSSTQLFSGYYISGTWTGQLLACTATTTTCIASNATWKATDGIPAAASRNIFTYNGTTGATFPTTAQAATLGGTDAVDYIRGLQTKELQNGGTLRNRATVLGDIVDSSPAYVSATGTVYVGANDGMLHAFNASTGKEVFAYVPAGISMADLATLPSTDYAHRYFVDGPIVASTTSQTAGQNILVGALGRGGKGLYALDVTTPSSFAASNVLWEATETTGKNMGRILGKPFIAKLNDGTMALVTGNGINSSTGRAVLLVYNLKTGALIKEIDTGSGGTTTATTNGLFAPTGWDSDSNGTVDYVYAGDLQGHVWKFDLSSGSPALWSVSNSGSALFTATNDSGTAQPITSGILLVKHPTTLATWVFFGTGRYLVTGDLTDKSVQTMYGVIDGGATVARSALTQRSILVSTTADGYSVRGFQSNTALSSTSKGWYINLLTNTADPQGERVVSTPQIQGSTLIFTTIIPTSDGCQSDGTGWVNALDAFTGTSAASSYFDLDGSGSTADDTITSNGTTVAVGSVSLGVGMLSTPVLYNGQLSVSGSTGTTTTVGTTKLSGARTSWREVLLED